MSTDDDIVAEVMRRRMAGTTVNCCGCKHFHPYDGSWCYKFRAQPITNIFADATQCPGFQPGARKDDPEVQRKELGLKP